MKKYPRIDALVKSILFWIIFLILLVASGSSASFFPYKLSRLLSGPFEAAGAFIATWIIIKSEKISFAAIGLIWEGGTFLRFIKGLFIGSIIFALMLFALISLTGLHIQTNSKGISSATLLGCLTLIPLALMEEVGFRAYSFLKLNSAFGLRITQLITALAFGIYHVVNGWSVYTSFTGPFVWAFVFGLSAIWSKGISMPTGIHAALNIGQLLSGTSGSTNAVWKVAYIAAASKADLARTEHIILALQIVVLICAVGLTEVFIRKNKSLSTLK